MRLSSLLEKLSPSRSAGGRDHAQALRDFERDGYVIFRQAVEEDLIEAFWEEVAALRRDEPDLTYGLKGQVLTNRDVLEGRYEGDPDRLRITSIENFSRYAPAMMLHPQISGFLSAVYGMAPTCIQTLTYRFSSQQGLHSDKYLVSPRSVGRNYARDTLTASWIACDPVSDENGALVIYPGSHRLEKKRLAEDFEGRYTDYVSYLTGLCEEAGIVPERFHAEKGDVLFWHGDFVHAGGKILDKTRTRRSLVCHYAALQPGDPGARAGRHKVSAGGQEASGGYYFVDDSERAPSPAS